MNRFRARFTKRHTVFPVIHAATQGQVLSNVDVALEAGADGVFLVNHEVPHRQVMAFHDAVRDRHPDLWVGVNSLDAHPTWVTQRLHVGGMWSDSAYVFEDKEEQPIAERLYRAVHDLWRGIYFGGVAFKGQRRVRPEHYGIAAKKATSYVDVVTTSGPGTGVAADVDKIRTMKEAIGEFPLAVASGITPDNVGEYLPYVDAFLVATGISRDFHTLDPDLTLALVERVRAEAP